MVIQAFNPSTLETEASRSLSLGTTWLKMQFHEKLFFNVANVWEWELDCVSEALLVEKPHHVIMGGLITGFWDETAEGTILVRG